MKTTTATILAASLFYPMIAIAQDAAMSVTDENYAFVMSDLAMQAEYQQGASNTSWHHHRSPIALDAQPAPMMNRDTLYSFSVIDGGADVTITLPETNGRYQSLHVWNHDHVTYKVFYGAGSHVVPAEFSTDFFVANVRTQIDSKSADDVVEANGLQDSLSVEFPEGYEPKEFQPTKWNMDEFEKIHPKYVAIAEEEGVTGTMGWVDNEVSLEDRNRGVSIALGLLPDSEAVYLTAKYTAQAGETLKATYAIPEQVDPELGFYSITIYGDDQYLKTDQGSTISNTEIVLNDDGKSFDIYYVPEAEFGQNTNELIIPTEEFWINFRIYLPAESVQNGEFVLPVPASN